MNIAWIGTGIMGAAMLSHLHEAGHQLHLYNRTEEKAKQLEQNGITAFSSIGECIKDCDVVFTMVGYPNDVEEVYTKNGIFAHAKKGALLIDMTTSSPQLAARLYEEAKTYGLHMLDAPVSGGDSGAINGTLSIMAGGDEDDYQKAYPLFCCMGKEIHHMGKAGCGQHAKAANQIAVAGAVAAMSEAIHYMRMNHLVEEETLKVIANGAAGSWQLLHTAPKVLKNDFQPGFYIKHFIKDMKIIQDVMKEHHEHLPMLDTVCSMYEELQKNGHENDGTQALIKHYEK